LTFEGQRNTA